MSSGVGGLLVCLFGGLAVVCVQAQEGEAVWSEGFEEGMSARGLPEGWVRHWDVPAEAQLSLVEDPVAEGKQALRMEFGGGLKAHWLITPIGRLCPRVKPLTIYTFSLRLMFDVEGGQGRVDVRPERTRDGLFIYAGDAPRAGGFKKCESC